jgi:hypothetical protein
MTLAWLRLPSEKGSQLTEAEGEALFQIFRAAVSKTIASDVLTVEGTGRYKVLPQTGTTDQVTSITVSQENVDGCLIILNTETTGHTITYVNSSNLRLMFGNNVEVPGVRSTLWLRHEGGGVWHQALPLVFIPS